MLSIKKDLFIKKKDLLTQKKGLLTYTEQTYKKATENSHGKKSRQIAATIPTANTCGKFLRQIATENNHYKYMRRSANSVTFNALYNKKKFHAL